MIRSLQKDGGVALLQSGNELKNHVDATVSLPGSSTSTLIRRYRAHRGTAS